jgi:hypothetical protein
MADYIRFRLTAAKAGASMALLALIGGFAARGDAAPATVNAIPAKASTGSFLKLGGIKGNAKTSFLKIEQKVLKIDSALASLQHKLATSYYSAQKIDSTFLKIKSANSTFLKIDDAAKIYLNGSDAAARFLKIDGTAANASELGGQAPGAFFQGRGNVVTGAVTFAPGTTTPLLEDSHGIIAVLITGNADQTQFMINNNSGVPLEAVVQDQTTAAMTLNQGLNLLPAVQRANNGAGELHVQIMPGGAFNQVVTLILGVAPAFADGSLSATKISATGQMLIGLL